MQTWVKIETCALLATAKSMLLLLLLVGMLASTIASEAYAYRNSSIPTQYLNDRLCHPSDYLESFEITSGVDEYLRQNLTGFSIGDYVALEYKGEIFYQYDAFDGVGNRFYILSDACQQIIGPYYYTSRIDFFE